MGKGGLNFLDLSYDSMLKESFEIHSILLLELEKLKIELEEL